MLNLGVSQQKFIKKGGNLWHGKVDGYSFLVTQSDLQEGEIVEADAWNGKILDAIVIKFLEDVDCGKLYLARKHGAPSLSPQISRYKSSKKVKVIEIDRDAELGIFEGRQGSEYQASLDDCECRDYILKKQPCKHMYRLASELDAFNWPEQNQPGWVTEFKQYI